MTTRPPMTPAYRAVVRRVTFEIAVEPNVSIILEEVGMPTTSFVVGRQTPGPSFLGVGKGFMVYGQATFATYEEAEDEIIRRLAAYPAALAGFTGSDAC
jgi:hypothetical protein